MSANDAQTSRRRARIVCTLGPATDGADMLRELVEAGMDVARLNYSHGSPEAHAALARRVRKTAENAGRAVGVLADLPGPKIRLDTFKGGAAELVKGETFVITTESVQGDASRASTSYAALARDVHEGDTVLVDDGTLALEVLDTNGTEVRTRVVRGGTVSDKKGINLPGVKVSAPALDARNVELLRHALSCPADMIAMSFVRSPDDALAARAVMDEVGLHRPLIAKIEKPEAVERLEEIVEAFDGLMVARGDLGVEMPLELVPLTQKHAVQLARERGKPVIVATQMLDSMISSPRPTRAEASDVANAVFDGADALMLSGETSVGEYPLESVRTMARIICAAESDGFERLPKLSTTPSTTPDAIALAATQVTRTVNARALVAFTTSGTTVRRLASHRDPTPLYAFTPYADVQRQLSVVWGVEVHVLPFIKDTDHMIEQVDNALVELGRGTKKDRVVIVAGMPAGNKGSTNTIRVHRLGNPVKG